MKKLSTSFFMRAAIAIALLFATTGTAAAYDFMYNGLAYNYDGDGTSVYVTYTSTNSDNYGGSLTNVVIPAKITLEGNVSYNVTGIGQYAFSNCTNLQSITIPSSVKTIGSDAFYNTNIKKLTISSVDAWVKTALNARVPTPHEIYVGSQLLTSVTIPSTVTTVGSHFSNVTSIKSVTIPNSVTEIGASAFNNCTNLATLNLGTGVQTIGQYAFQGCTAITSITFPSSLKTIGYYAFQGCSGLTSLTIPENIETLDGGAFYYCTGIKSLTWNAKNLTSNGGIPTQNITSVTIGSNVQTIPDNFVSNSKITSVSFPSSVKTIGASAFNGCASLTSVAIPNGCDVKSMAFANCPLLQSVTIPATITYQTNIFQNCTGIKKLTWKPVSISTSQFVPTSNIETVSISSGVKELPSNFVAGSKITSVSLPTGLTTIGSYAFQGCSGLSSLSLPSNLATIGSYAFQNCNGITSLTIPENLTSIGSNAFSGCNYITQLTWNAINLTTNGGISTGNITKVTIGSQVQYLPSNFVRGSKITTVTIPSSVTTIDPSAFESCSLLTSITIPSSVRSWGSSMFKNCTSLKTVSLPSTMLAIPQEMFYGCTSLASAPLPANMISIGNSAFYNCTGLTALTIPEKLNSIGSNVFYGCSSITQLTWNAVNLTTNGGITTSNITKVTIGSKVETIPSNFVKGSKITSVSFPSSVRTIGENAFNNCPNLITIRIPESVTSIGGRAFGGSVPKKIKFYNASELQYLEFWFWNNNYNNTPLCTIGKGVGYGVTLDPNTSFVVDGITYVITDMTNRKVKIVDVDETKCATDIEVKKVKYRNVEFTPTELGFAALAGNYTVKSFKFGDLITAVPNYAFYESVLSKAVIPNSITSIGQHAFENCKRMTEFVVGTGVNTIDQYVLAGCSALRRVELGANVTTINANSFNGCSKIKTLRVRRSTPPAAVNGVFNDLDKWSCTLYVPKGTVNAYKNANEWKTFFFISDSETEPSEGDVNGDGNVNVTDVTTLVNMILGVVEKDETAADVDGNGVVNVSDVTALVNLILGVG